MNEIFAIRFGMGYWIISPPYNNDSCYKFKRTYNLPNNAIVIKKNEFNSLLENINYSKKIGMMTLNIQNGIPTTTTSITGATSYKHRKLNNRTYNIHKTLTPAIYQLFDEKSIGLDKTQFEQSISIIRKLCNHIADMTNISIQQVWNCLLDYNVKTEGRLQDKIKVLSHYGNGIAQCVKCGNTDLRVLSIDHINGGGYSHLKELNKLGHTLYTWLIKNDYPKGYQTLCMNCQWVKKAENNEYRSRTKNNTIPTSPTSLSIQRPI